MFAVGQKLFIRTVTYHMVGEVEAVEGSWLRLRDASWIADSGRFNKALSTGEVSEAENVGIAYVNLDTACDVFPWEHELPVPTK